MTDRPAAARSRIACTIDLDAPGRQVGHMAIPHSTNTSAWGSIRMPIASLRNGDGPCVLFTGGNHGDEYEGQIALIKLIRALDPARLRGHVMVLPGLNFPAVRAGSRLSPVDGGNMNRAFPGARDGTVTSMIAHFVSAELLPRADIVVDIHSGGRTLTFLPCAVMHHLEDRSLMARTLEALRVFGAPCGLVLVELDSEGMLDTAVENLGKIFLSTELGGGGTTTPETVAIADTGVHNLLVHFGLIEGELLRREDRGLPPTRLLETPDASSYVIAGGGGLLEALVEPGDEVRRGQMIARIHSFERPAEPPQELAAQRDGVLVGRHFPTLIADGDCAAVIASDYRPAA